MRRINILCLLVAFVLPLHVMAQVSLSIDSVYKHPYNLNCIMLRLSIANNHSQDIYLEKKSGKYLSATIIFKSIDSVIQYLNPEDGIALITIKNYSPVTPNPIGFVDYFPQVNNDVKEFEDNFLSINTKLKPVIIHNQKYYVVKANTTVTFNIILSGDFMLNKLEAFKIMSEKDSVDVVLHIPIIYTTYTSGIKHKIWCSVYSPYLKKAVLDQFDTLRK